MNAPQLLVVHDDDLGMDYGGDHPTDRRRHRLAVALAREAGVLDAPGVEMFPARGPMDDEHLAQMFAPAFIRAIRGYSATPVLAATPEARQWGIGGDIDAYKGMHEDSARLCQAAWDAASAVGEGRARSAIVPAGGAHHGVVNRAWGFGIYNDTAVAVHALRAAGAERIAYVDIDVHHGNGTQWIFWDDPGVLTLSVHESGNFLFPGSGFPSEIGGPGAEGSAINVSLPPYAGDDAYRRVVAEVVEPAVRAFRPDAIVSQCGVDHHHADPLAHILTTMPLYPEIWRSLHALAADCCDGRWVVLAGGGYDPCTAPPRAWASLMARMAEVDLPRETPASWRAIAADAGCAVPATGWTDDPGPEPDATRDARATAEVDAAIAETRSVSTLLGA